MKYWPEDFYHKITSFVYHQYKYFIPLDAYHHIKLFSRNLIMAIMVIMAILVIMVIIMVNTIVIMVIIVVKVIIL